MIVDASALLLFAEPGLDAGRIRDALRRVQLREPLEAPALLAYEVGHAIHRKNPLHFGATAGERSGLRARLLTLLDLQLPKGHTLETAGRTAEAQRMSFYDASYLAIALETRSRLLTADAGLHAHALSRGVESYLLPEDAERLAADYPLE